MKKSNSMRAWPAKVGEEFAMILNNLRPPMPNRIQEAAPGQSWPAAWA